MKAVLKVISLLLFFSALITSCAPVTAVPVPTIAPTQSLAPTNTSLPEPSATATLSPAEKLFTIPTMQGVLVNTPTAIATPIDKISSAKLQNLSEQDTLRLVYEMNKYSYQNYPSFRDWWTDGHFVDSQEPVALAIQEYLYHFPQNPNADRLRWQLAFIDSITSGSVKGNDFGDKWLIGELQKGLDQGNILPDQLEALLVKSPFKIDYFQTVENLFGDGATAWLYVISPQVWKEEAKYSKSPDFFDRGGLFVAIHQINKGKFKIEFLANAWDFLNGSSSLFKISDSNKNGIPEIALNLWRQSGTMCAGNFKIFEWRNNSFVDLTRGEVKINDCFDGYEYSLVEGKPSIIFHQFSRKVPAVYTWNGNYYEFKGYQYSNLVERWSAVESFFEEADAIEAILSSENTGGLSSSQIDFLRFRLGIVYALNSNVLDEKRVLQDLVNNPSDKSRTIYSNLAKNFLRYYSGDQSLMLTCKKSREILDRLWDRNRDNEEIFGIPYDIAFGPGLLQCLDQDVFEVLIRKLPITVEDVPRELRKNGMNLYYAEKQDVNLDGSSDEWLMIFDDGIFVVAPSRSSYKTAELEYFWGSDDVMKYSKVEVNISRWAGIREPVMTVFADHELAVLSIGENYTATDLSFDYDVENIVFSSEDSPPGYQVFYIKPKLDNYYGVPWSGYRWDSDRQQFRDDLIEYELFVEHDPIKAIELAKTILPILMDWRGLDSVSYWLPRYFYLCGLSYELSGDAQKAAEIYWQLWHDFPESHYALLARYKLELINP